MPNNAPLEHVWLDCECADPHHTLRVWTDDDNKLIIEHCFDDGVSLFQRIKNALAHIFRPSSLCIQATYLDTQSCIRLRDAINEVVEE